MQRNSSHFNPHADQHGTSEKSSLIYLNIGRFLAHMDQLFLRGSALPPQAWHCLLACLKKCVTIKISDSLG